jgi:hypothetical protein
MGDGKVHHEGPKATDLENVSALNEAFLTMLRRSPHARKHLFGLRSDVARQLIELSPRRAARLAEVPFLLFSFRERDEPFWRPAFEVDTTQDLFATAQQTHGDVSRLIDAGLGFIWHLAKQNPYVLRMLCGASVHWCEQIAEHPLIQILGFASSNHEMLVMRLEKKTEVWLKLLDAGVSDLREVRRAAHISALQTVLTYTEEVAKTAWASAACRTQTPILKVADKNAN